MTAFLRSNRGVDSDVHDTFTIILQYSGEQKNLVVTIKTAIVTHMKDQLRFFVRGTRGTYLKVSGAGHPVTADLPPSMGGTNEPHSSELVPRRARPSQLQDNRQRAQRSASSPSAYGAR